ncbi:MAG: NUDIX domain-containing protein [Gemmatimonadota bacterium]
MKPGTLLVSVAIRHDGQVLIVQRPGDDEDLPNLWGLPAASLRADEDWHEAVRRAGREKLGVELKVGRELTRGALERSGYTLEMRLYEASIEAGVPVVPQPDTSVTQYQAWKWGSGADLKPAAARGSLCCRLFLDVGDGD